ncbi:alpha-(1,3)-fucosyltransferase fut-5-like [Clytia hemisphaerica]|uniref:Fucosyltransferase n=1 Tax=Clytia hemisphaerica TaxID=252671 RepID=A0A7M5WUF6_9CNID
MGELRSILVTFSCFIIILTLTQYKMIEDILSKKSRAQDDSATSNTKRLFYDGLNTGKYLSQMRSSTNGLEQKRNWESSLQTVHHNSKTLEKLLNRIGEDSPELVNKGSNGLLDHLSTVLTTTHKIQVQRTEKHIQRKLTDVLKNSKKASTKTSGLVKEDLHIVQDQQTLKSTSPIEAENKPKTASSAKFENKKHAKNISKRKTKKLIFISLGLYNDRKEVMRSIPSDYNMTEMDGSKCPINECQITYDRTLINQSDAIFFDGRIIHELDIEILKRLRSKSESQIWIWMMHENPNFTYYNITQYDQFFNWSATYRPSSDIYIPYFGIQKLPPSQYLKQRDAQTMGHHSVTPFTFGRTLTPGHKGGQKKTPSLKHRQLPYLKNFAEGKDKKVLVVISHCDEYRMQMIRTLRQYIPVDLYGGCKDIINPELVQCHRDSPECEALMKRYKFYLAIENFYCTDYVTEKYYLNGLIRHIVPIVLNGGNYSDNENVFLPKSYINIEKFDTLKKLGEYLNYLDKNDTAYNEYHQWSYEYSVEPKHCMCKVCKALWDHEEIDRPIKTLKLSDFWDAEKLCQSYDREKFQKYIYIKNETTPKA